jgi:hypothetical protein
MLGAFITGLIVPREGGLAIALTEKLEDMVAVIFLPLVCLLFWTCLVPWMLTPFSILVFHAFWAEHEPGFVG